MDRKMFERLRKILLSILYQGLPNEASDDYIRKHLLIAGASVDEAKVLMGDK